MAGTTTFDITKECTTRLYKKEFLLDTCKKLNLECKKTSTNIDLCNQIKKKLTSGASPPAQRQQKYTVVDDVKIKMGKKIIDFSRYKDGTFYRLIPKNVFIQILAFTKAPPLQKDKPTKKDYAQAIYNHLAKKQKTLPVTTIKKVSLVVNIGDKKLDFKKWDKASFYNPIKKDVFLTIAKDLKLVIDSGRKKKDIVQMIYHKLRQGQNTAAVQAPPPPPPPAPVRAPSPGVVQTKQSEPPSKSPPKTTTKMSISEIRQAVRQCLSL